MTDETAKEKYRFEMQQDERAKARLRQKGPEGYKCPKCQSELLYWHMKEWLLICQECDAEFAPCDAHSDEPPDHVIYAKENPR